MKSALVSGGAGFIGSHLCEALCANNFSVTCIDNLLTGKIENISALSYNKNFSFVKADISKSFPNEILEKKFSHVFNLACP
ncbi:MAG: GDP-mannose 4,6-dehydratase, partial [archaeon]